MSSLSPFSKNELIPQPEVLEIQKQKSELFIGIPKETHFEEKRISLTPDAVSALVAHGHRIVIETGAGTNANFSDKAYSDAGAKIAYNKKEVYQCSLILKVEPPSLDEIDLMNTKTTLISALQIKTRKKEYFEALSKKKITALAFDFIEDEDGHYPLVKSLSEIAGIASIHIANELMSSSNGGSGLLFGNISGVPPTDVVILGAGTVGTYAAKSAIAMGARVKIFDNSITKLRKLQDKLITPVYTSTLQPKNLLKALMRCDVIIGAIRGQKRSPIIVSQEMIERMKEGTVIVDVSIDRGGCFETSKITTHSNPTFTNCGVVHYCVPNIPSRYARTASVSISNFFTPFLLNIAEDGGLENTIRFQKNLRTGIYLYHGVITKKIVSDWFDIPSKDINLLIL